MMEIQNRFEDAKSDDAEHDQDMFFLDAEHYQDLFSFDAEHDEDLFRLAEESAEVKRTLQTTTKMIKLKRGITIDSGAANNVMPHRMVRNKKMIRATPSSKRGVHYVAANGGRIPNDGEFDFEFSTQEGNEESTSFQIAEVNKAFGAVSYLVDNGYNVIFDKDQDSGKDLSLMIQKASGRITRFRRNRNIWVLDAMAKAEGFGRPA